ncbi:HLH-domain-containing protein [Daedalea quercina L-15889]|uniref:HLH-domain-containing protein n=1 Tax=Daedalea quercina L-15889 TaxID=1314783 RepID=A0A165PNC7_9APHY|nr:HLH-domain-containing protein [Daedalea quercina L-15889]
MTSAFFPSYKPQVLSRQEGFHLPSPAPSHNPPSPPSSNGTPSNAQNTFDPNNLFLPPFLSIPDPFRKFPSSAETAASMDFTDELASLIGSEHQSSERSTQNGTSANGANGGAYDEYRPPTHNIFDISAPTSHHHHSAHAHSHSFHAQSPFSLGGSSTAPSNGNGNGQQQQQQQPEFAHANFNSTLPALGSSMRYEPPPAPAPHSPFSLGHPHAHAHSLGTPGAEPSSFSSHLSSLSFSTASNAPNGDLLAHHQPRQTPSPVSVASPTEFSRSRSRSTTRQAQQQQQQPGEPPSTNGGPARRTRAKRGSVSSVSPPPLHRGHTQPLIIPGNNLGGMGVNGRGPASPLGLHGSGWFVPGGQGEFSLPTPDSVHGGFSAFTGASSLPATGHMGVSPKDVSAASMLGKSLGGLGGDSPPCGDLATKQALIASEKRRRRRESHNAVERRRRDNINEKISELATLIPECLLDPNATLTMPVSLSASSDDLLFGAVSGGSANGGAGAPAKAGAEPAKKEEKDGSAEPDDKDGQEGINGAVKANKGMILRKSVEYIRYLQQLVSAQASRNRDLEQQLQAFRSTSAPASAADQDEGALVLHEEVADELTLFGSPSPASANPARRKRFARGELASVEEMDMDDEEGDVDMQDEKSSPSAAGEDEDGEDGADGGDGEEEMRGRKGRDGRPAGTGASVNLKERVKLEESGEMVS